MIVFLTRLTLMLRARFKSRVSLEAENVVLRQQLSVLNRRSPIRLRLRNIDRLVLVCLCRLFPSLLEAIIIVKPKTVLSWHPRGFRAYWHWKSWRRGGRPRIDRALQALIQRMSPENPTWGAPRIHGRAIDARDRCQRVDCRTIHDQDRPTAVVVGRRSCAITLLA